MHLGDKIRYLREVEGALRGLGHEMTQQEVVRTIKKESAQNDQPELLSQIGVALRPHLTNSTRLLLARFFKVHPGYLVDDPEGYPTELISDVGARGKQTRSLAHRRRGALHADTTCTKRCSRGAA